jgi:hypothetical protein
MVNALVPAFTDYQLSINLIGYALFLLVALQLIIDHVVQIKIAISKSAWIGRNEDIYGNTK